MKNNRPNILIIYTDQQRWDTIRYAGNPNIITPNLDDLASRGVLFKNAFSNAPVCMPSRMSMLSGQYPSTLGVCCNGIEMPEHIPTLATILGQYGYSTANIGKLHFKNHSNRDHREPYPSYGFDTLIISEEPGCYDDAYIKWVELQNPSAVDSCRSDTPPEWTGKPIRKNPRNTHEPYIFEGPENLTHSCFVASEIEIFLRSHENLHKPFFAIAGFYAPHTPLNPPKRFVELYNPDNLPLPIMNKDENKLELTDIQWQKIKAYYYALITHVDEEIGKILRVLDETKQRNNTIVIFTSDHGEHLGDHGAIQKGPPGYDSCIHVPLIISIPENQNNGSITNELVEAVDIAPTILDMCSVQIPPFFQGISLVKIIRGEKHKQRKSTFMESRIPFGKSWKTIRTKDFKLCISNSAEELLFDLKKDPNELQNRAKVKNYQNVLMDMRKELLSRWFKIEKQYPLKTGQY